MWRWDLAINITSFKLQRALQVCTHGFVTWPRGVTVSTLDSESSDRGSNPREAFWFDHFRHRHDLWDIRQHFDKRSAIHFQKGSATEWSKAPLASGASLQGRGFYTHRRHLDKGASCQQPQSIGALHHPAAHVEPTGAVRFQRSMCRH